jgi:hypothetical protein
MSRLTDIESAAIIGAQNCGVIERPDAYVRPTHHHPAFEAI